MVINLKILVLSHDIPSKSFSDTIAAYYLIKNLNSNFGHNITLISFKTNKVSSEDVEDLSNYCSVGAIIPFNYTQPIYKMILDTIKNNSIKVIYNIKHKIFFNLLDYYYSSDMEREIAKILSENTYDLIYVTRPMSIYVLDVNIPKIIQPYDAIHEWHRQVYLYSSGIKKFLYGVSYNLTKMYESSIYEKFDRCLVVTNNDKILLENLNKNIQCDVIPNGIDTTYYMPLTVEEDFPSLIFVGDMSGQITKVNVPYFYNTIYLKIRHQIPNIKLYLVGRNPGPEIRNLASDSSVVVTGFVEDTRVYLAKASLFIAPMIVGTGIKNKVLEAMSMAKPVISTSVGAQGISATNGKELIIADDPKYFIDQVISLLNNKPLRETIGKNASILMQKQYTWEKTTEKFNELIIDVVTKHNINNL